MIYIILKKDILHYGYFYFLCFKYIVMVILLLNAGLLLVAEYFYTVVLLL